MKFAIIGNGLIGRERLKALESLSWKYDIEEICVFDVYTDSFFINPSKNAIYTNDFDYLLRRNPDLVVIATPHNVVLDYVKRIKDLSCIVLIEKPSGRSLEEAIEIERNLCGKNCFVGFNYRFFGGIRDLLSDIEEEKFGEIISVNMVVGHGGSEGDRDSWKLDPIEGSRDCLLDPGIHFLDIINRAFPLCEPVFGRSWRGFWDTGIEEEVHLILKRGKTIINLQTSLVKWRSTFRIEVNGTDGYGIVEGRGRSYGNQTYISGKRWQWKESGLPQRMTETKHIETVCDLSFYDELDAILGNKTLPEPCNIYQSISNVILYRNCVEVMKC